jgi:prepilin-type N-terminal cleavage/methylation domain-containing protein
MKKTVKFAGFTLIELLIVIGLLAALAAVLLPSLMGDREEAMRSIDKYNGAGTLRTLRQYEAMTGELPNGLHTGLTVNDGDANLMTGVSEYFATNFAKGELTTLTASEAKALSDTGIKDLAYGAGDPEGHERKDLGYVKVDTGTYVISLPMQDGEDDENNPVELAWKDKNGKPVTFNGKGPHYLGHENFTKVIALFITPTAEWRAEGKNWVKGFQVGMDIPATSPLPESGEFPYYIAYVGIQGDGWTVEASEPKGGPHIHLHQLAKTAADAISMLNEEMGEATGGSFGNLTWSSGSSADGDTATATFTNEDNDDISYTFTLKYRSQSQAVLLGTSSADCVSTNP